jgi:glycerol-3-phosphate dehydrogenase
VAAKRGKKVLLVEQEDFASGTSQASGMMVWGGLLYLRNFRFRLVRKLSRARDQLLSRYPDRVELRRFTFLPLRKGGRPSWFVHVGLQLYRALSGFCRGPVRAASPSGSGAQLLAQRFSQGWSYEEGFLTHSDARFALDWILTSGQIDRALNHTEIESLHWDPEARRYAVTLKDRRTGGQRRVQAERIVNCAGPWADSLNARWGVGTSYRHFPSKGVYLILPSEGDDRAYAMEMEHHGDTLCWVPWGPVALWGPTETDAAGPEDRLARKEDVDFLLERLNRNSQRRWTRNDILNVRVGIRPLALPPGVAVGYSLDLSRRAVLEMAPDRPWATAFGGKISGALDFAIEMHNRLHQDALLEEDLPFQALPERPTTSRFFHGLAVVEPEWARQHEACRTLEDYLRRRTNAAQWIANGGLGKRGEHLEDLRVIAKILHGGDIAAADQHLEDYVALQHQIRRSWSDE